MKKKLGLLVAMTLSSFATTHDSSATSSFTDYVRGAPGYVIEAVSGPWVYRTEAEATNAYFNKGPIYGTLGPKTNLLMSIFGVSAGLSVLTHAASDICNYFNKQGLAQNINKYSNLNNKALKFIIMGIFLTTIANCINNSILAKRSK